MDAEHHTLFSLSGYKGNRPVVGSVVRGTHDVRNGAIAVMILPDVFMGVLSPKEAERALRVISIHPNGRDGSCASGLVW